MITQILSKIIGSANERALKALQPLVVQINALENEIKHLQDSDFPQRTITLKTRYQTGSSLDELLPEAFALVREAALRTIGQRHYDVQLIGGIVLHQGKIAEMKTGEGKTLTATLPLYLNALTGKGVHLVTVNDYLARRDAEWMGKVFEFLGLSTGCLQNSMSDEQRREVYNKDILYGTNNELGFDYLRDNMKFRLEDYVQRELAFAIVDEVDSILIDEARTPLIISGSVDDSSKLYIDVNRVVSKMQKNTHYDVNEKDRQVFISDAGIDIIEKAFNIHNLYAIEHLSLLHHVNQALRAHALFKIDVDYVVKDGQVLIVDEFTGRILAGRRYSDGLHQALEAKENVKIEQESQTLASITLQNFFRMYKKLAGMTGTATTEAEEFYSIYKLNVVSIPTNKPMIRKDQADLIFLTNNAKYKAIVEDVAERHKKGQPVLIGTIAIETSERLSQILHVHGIPHDVLNAKQHQREAEIIKNAGLPGKVTIATNMAGRGTDIKLAAESIEAGGLYILGTERHESRRIDNQLRGRSGRQGDPGESRFYISLEDDLIRVFSSAGDSLKQKMEWFGMKEDEVIESRSVSRVIERSQEKVEKHYYEMRKHLIEYDDVLNQQRIVIYRYRKEALDGKEEAKHLVYDFIEHTVSEIVTMIANNSRMIHQETLQQIIQDLVKLFGCQKSDLTTTPTGGKTTDQLIIEIAKNLLKKYDSLHKNKDLTIFEQAEKWLILETIDQSWKQHMLNLDHLKEGIGLRGWGQKNPLIEYKREAFDMFKEMMNGIRQSVIFHIFRLQIEQFNQEAIESKRERELDKIKTNATEDDSVQTIRHSEPTVGRNEQCSCGSGKKYKKCHGK
ncbi:preprotein translocase subunit SecA [bacterium]|nr:MAG: preprotein translocase subunit SecA [bacterium]QQR61380.1 MAG: preprotein translocase subunit SecA [bacterium]QQR63100.1 MAG: preprotein translocase subunit SecA [bacterium]